MNLKPKIHQKRDFYFYVLCLKIKKITAYMYSYLRPHSSPAAPAIRGNKMLDFLAHFGNQNHTSAWVIILNDNDKKGAESS